MPLDQENKYNVKCKAAEIKWENSKPASPIESSKVKASCPQDLAKHQGCNQVTTYGEKKCDAFVPEMPKDPSEIARYRMMPNHQQDAKGS